MKRDINYFRDEVRNGFYIPTVIKQAWAMCLDVLSEIDRICTKYDITYYADWGTFLGAVRHGGFVPWDDDMDIAMKREDYIRFREVADKELPEHYDIHDYERKEDHWLFLSRVVNNKKICYDEKYLEEHYNFPWLAAVDIFVKDYLYMDEEKEKERDKDILFLISLADGIREKEFKTEVIKYHLSEIEKKYQIKLPELSHERDLCISLYKIAERRMSEVKPEDSDTIGQIFPWILKGDKGQPKGYFEKTVKIPFEDITITVPARYNEALTARYGNFNEIHKVWWAHTYPFFEGQRKELERVNGAPIPEYTFTEDMLLREKKDDSSSLKSITRECITEIETLINAAEQAINRSEAEIFTDKLTQLQQLVIDLGTLIEEVKGEEKPSAKAAVSSLEKFCEVIFSAAGNGTVSELRECFENVRAVLIENIVERKEVLFLPIGPEEWEGFSEAYKMLKSEGKTDIYVIPLPLFKKDPLGQVKISQDEIKRAIHLDEYPKNVECSDYDSYKLFQHCPDKIFVQNPYDGRNPLLTVPPEFYVKNLRKYTDEIVFIPFAKTSEFEDRDMTDMYNLKHYAVAPGVIYSDKVIVQSENIRKHYVDKLTEFGGEETREFWNSKITSDGYPVKKQEEDLGAILCIGVSELVENGEKILDKIEKQVEELRKRFTSEKITFTFYPEDRREWKKLDEILSEKVFELVDGFIKEGSRFMALVPREADKIAERYNSLYGSSSPLVPAFTIKGKYVSLFSGCVFNEEVDIYD